MPEAPSPGEGRPLQAALAVGRTEGLCHPSLSPRRPCPCGVLYLCAVCLCVCTATALPAQQAVSLCETEGRRSTRKHSFIWIYFSFYFLIRVAATSSGIQQGLGPQSPSLSHPASQWTFHSGCPPRPISTSGAVRAQCSVHKTNSHIILGRFLCSFSAAGCRTQPSHCHLGGSRSPLQHHQAGLAVIFPKYFFQPGFDCKLCLKRRPGLVSRAEGT